MSIYVRGNRERRFLVLDRVEFKLTFYFMLIMVIMVKLLYDEGCYLFGKIVVRINGSVLNLV